MDRNDLDRIDQLLSQIQSGDDDAKRQLFELLDEQFRRLTRKMLGTFSIVRRWEQTDDVWQNASLRIWRSLDKMSFESARHFLNTGALQIRRELLTLAEYYRRPSGTAAHHNTPIGNSESQAAREFANPTDNLDVLDSWTEMHQKVEQLEPELLEVFDLHWYQGLTMEDIASLTGVSSRTVKRRWQAARLALYESVGFRM